MHDQKKKFTEAFWRKYPKISNVNDVRQSVIAIGPLGYRPGESKNAYMGDK